MSIAEIAEFLSSSHGRLGRPKVIRLSTGVCMITREGILLIDALYDSTGDPLTKLALKAAKDVEIVFGDGAISFLLLASVFLQRVVSRSPFGALSVSEAKQFNALIRRRHCLSLVASILSRNETSLKRKLVNSKIWLTIGCHGASSMSLIEVARWIIKSVLSTSTRGEMVSTVECLVVSVELFIFHSNFNTCFCAAVFS